MMQKRILALLLTVLLCASIPLTAYADAYIPPEAYGYDILTAHEFNNTCKPLNVFLSNFAEIGLPHFAKGETDEETVVAAVLKHLELNAQYYPNEVSKVDGDDGKTYMKIKKSIFDTRMERLFDMSVDFASLSGYTDGALLVTADHLNGPIQVFASVYAVGDLGGGNYEVLFDVYFIEQDFSGWYTTSHDNLPQNNISRLGGGQAVVYYGGGETVESISTSDFRLVELSMEMSRVPCAGANLPYGYVEPTQPPATEAPTQAPTEAPTQAPTDAPEESTRPEKSDDKDLDQEDEREKEDEKDAKKQKSDADINLYLIVILVVAVTLLALVGCFMLILKKRK